MKRDLQTADIAALQPGLPGPPANPLEIGPPGEPRPRPRSGRRRLLWGVLLLLAALAFAAWSLHKSGRVIARSAVVKGEITEVGTRFSGMLASVEAAPGARVRAGEVLARLDSGYLRAQESEAAAQLEALERELVAERSAIEQDRATRLSRIQEVSARALGAQGELRAARLRVQEADEYRKLRESLARDGMISVDSLREVRTRASLAAESLEVAASNVRATQSVLRTAELDLAGLAVRQERIGVLRAQRDAARARLVRVRADMESALVKAPADGTVVRWLVNAGGPVDVGKPVVSFTLGARRWVEAWFDEDDAGRLRVGDAAVITMPYLPGKEFHGRIERVGITTDLEQPPVLPGEMRPTRIRVAPMVPVEVSLADPPEALLPGLSAVVAVGERGGEKSGQAARP